VSDIEGGLYISSIFAHPLISGLARAIFIIPSWFAVSVITIVSDAGEAKDTLVNNTREKKLISFICQYLGVLVFELLGAKPVGRCAIKLYVAT